MGVPPAIIIIIPGVLRASISVLKDLHIGRTKRDEKIQKVELELW